MKLFYTFSPAMLKLSNMLYMMSNFTHSWRCHEWMFGIKLLGPLLKSVVSLSLTSTQSTARDTTIAIVTTICLMVCLSLYYIWWVCLNLVLVYVNIQWSLDFNCSEMYSLNLNSPHQRSVWIMSQISWFRIIVLSTGTWGMAKVGCQRLKAPRNSSITVEFLRS